jgi:hypothetical protein
MRISKDSAIELQNKLPKGSAESIRIRLKKRGIIYSQGYIYRCLDPQLRAYNKIIIDEAIVLGEELTQEIIQREERVAQLRKLKS